MNDKGKQARALFEQGYNCAQSVASAFAEEVGLPFETMLRLASPFGGGIGRTRGTCGAISAIMMILGLREGYSSPADDQAKKELYVKVQKLIRQFREEKGSILCRDLLGLDEDENDPTPEKRTPQYYMSRPCSDLVEYAANLISKELD